MQIVIDSREKKCDHIKQWFDLNGIEYMVRKLDVGDYYAIYNPVRVCVDRKQNLQELSKNLINRRDHSRFLKEIRRANKLLIKLYILCEHGNGIEKIEDVIKWRDKYTGVSGRILLDAIYKIKIAYGVEFMFCEPKDTAKKIIEIFSI